MASLNDAIKGMEKSVDGLISKLTSASSTMSGPGGRISTGSNFLNNALGAFSTTPSVKYQSQFNMGMSAVQGAGQVASGITRMMPEISATMDRMTTSYNASLRATDGMSRRQLQETTLAGMRGGLTSAGSDAQVGGFLAMRGMVASSDPNSTFQQTLRGTNYAAQYLNMDNNRAAAALEGLSSGKGSANMLRQFGIFTADPRTGQVKEPGQIMGELYGRLTAGRGTASEEQVLESYRRGALGSTLANSGLSEDQQQMFVQYAIERARGNEMDISDPEQMQKIMEKAKADGRINPNQPGYDLNTSKTDAMQSAQEAYLSGIKLVTPALQAVTLAGGALASMFGGLTVAIAAITGSTVAGGAMSALGGVGKAAGAMGLMGMGKNAAGKVTGKGGGRGFSPKGFGIGAVASVAGGMVGDAIAGDSAAGSFQSRAGSAIGMAATGAGIGAMVGSVVPGIGTGIGAAIGGTIGGLAGFFGEGGDEGSSNTNGSGKPQAFKLMHPTKSAIITAEFGRRESAFTKGKITWPNGHKGIDYAGKQGDAIYASESGYATLHDGGELGKRVRIKHSNGMYTHYCHLSAISIKEGEVSKGSPVGSMGNTGGKSTGVHLHFALSTGPDTSSAIDPMPYLGGGGNYLSSPPQDAEQSASSNNPTSAGMTSAATNPGGEDSSAPNPSSNTNNVPGAKVNSIAGGGASPASGVEAYSAGSHYSSGGGANTAAAPEGGEDASDQPGYLSSPTNPAMVGRGKNGKESKTVTNNVSITVSIAKGTPEEARRFGYMLKQALEDENALKMMARK